MQRIAIIGAGIMGVTLAYRLAQAGMEVTVYERSTTPGGLASYLTYDGQRLDRYYHTILSSDMSMQSLIEEMGINHRLHFTVTRQGFYDDGQLHPFNTPLDLLRYPPLNLFQRLRLAAQIVYAQFENDASRMDSIPVEKWLNRVSGRQVFEKVWKPLLNAKFDSAAIDVPATYIWSRLRRMMGTRQGVTSTEMMCYLEGGYYTLIEALIEQGERLGVDIRLKTGIERIVIEGGQAVGIRTETGELVMYDAIISTLQSPILGQLLPTAPEDFRKQLCNQQYLGVICPLLILKKRLTPYYVLNITDTTVPFTAVVETTNLIDPQHTGGYHLVYLPKYVTLHRRTLRWTDEEIEEMWMRHFKRMFPDFDTANIEAFLIQRAAYVEPLRPIGTTHDIPTITTPVKRLYMGNTAMVYPELNNGESVTRLAQHIARQVLQDAPTWEGLQYVR